MRDSLSKMEENIKQRRFQKRILPEKFWVWNQNFAFVISQKETGELRNSQ